MPRLTATMPTMARPRKSWDAWSTRDGAWWWQYPTLLEAYMLILRRLGFNVAHTWLDDVLRGAALASPTVDDYMAAGARVLQYPDQPLT